MGLYFIGFLFLLFVSQIILQTTTHAPNGTTRVVPVLKAMLAISLLVFIYYIY